MFLKPKISNIRKRQSELKYSNSEISKKAGLPKNAIGRLIREENKKTSHFRAKAIAKALDCNVKDLFEDAK